MRKVTPTVDTKLFHGTVLLQPRLVLIFCYSNNLVSPCWRISIFLRFPTSKLNFVIKYLQNEDCNRKQDTVSQDNQSWVEVLNLHTYKALAIV